MDMDLGAWLRSLGLEQYEAAFRENAIDETVLPDLTDQDLEKLGVLLGHRRKLLRSESGGLFADVRDVVFMDNLRRFGGVPLPLMGRGICDMRGAA